MEDLLKNELSAETLAALNLHLNGVEKEENDDKNALLSEDFRLSQFWYDTYTADTLAKEAAGMSKGKVAFVSTPAAFQAFQRLYPENGEAYLFEFDERFGKVYPDRFVFYNYHQPLDISSEYHHQFDYILIDPPHLVDNPHNMDCMRQYMSSIKLLRSSEAAKTTIVTGTVLMESIQSEFDYHCNKFTPTFNSKLSNHFTTYTNYDSILFNSS